MKQKGITLVALVVTIIILLILAGVTLNLALGQDGIFSRAKVAAGKYQKEQENEIGLIDEIEDKMNEIETGLDVEKVTDTKPGELEEIDANTYEIGSIEDLIAFSYNVREGNTYEGKTVELKQSLDFNSNKSYVNTKSTDYEKYGYTGEIKSAIEKQGFIPIGEMPSEGDPMCFNGIFDGNWNTIYNLKINQNECLGIAFFAVSIGTIKNLGIENGNINTNFDKEGLCDTAMLVCGNAGKIENCYTTGIINAQYLNSSNTGGICASNGGNISNCYNKANINLIKKGKDAQNVRLGGIVGANDGGTVKNVYNKGNITIKQLGKDIANGGVVGGIVGLPGTSSVQENGYSVGKVSCIDEDESLPYSGLIGGCIGRHWKEHSIDKFFFLKDCVQTKGTDAIINQKGEEKTEQELKSEEFLNLLNQDNSGTWKKDENNINDGYPILSWE